MITILLLTIITALVSNGVNLITQKGKIGYFIARWYYEKDQAIRDSRDARTKLINNQFNENQSTAENLDEQKDLLEWRTHRLKDIDNWVESQRWPMDIIYDPILVCPTCMASFYGSIISIGYILLFTTDLKMWVIWPLVVLGSACLNAIVQKWAK